MKIYLDLIMILNFFFDLILLLSVAIILKRKIKYERLIISSFIGGLSILGLFISFNSLTLFVYKFLISVLMVIICFKFQNLKYFFNNLLFLYINSIVLGGFLYFLNIEFSYKREGLVFYHHGLSINFIILIILGPLIVYLYVKQIKKLKNNYNNYYSVDIFFNNQTYTYTGYIDSGNNLFYKGIPVILIDKKKIIFKIKEFSYMPYQALNYTGLLKLVKIDKVKIKEEIYKCYLGIMDNDIKIDGVDILLNNKMGG
ncbi:MAG: sigma-E processing peptidase SpoIIGA [Bacilli bacterium]|nr:sigma-E processing peptidase SpoIIGA [Bacilli bacterium]